MWLQSCNDILLQNNLHHTAMILSLYFSARVSPSCALCGFVIALLLCATTAANPLERSGADAKPLVVTTVKPLALIAAQALGDHVEVAWLYAPQQSPHDQPLRPSMMRQLAAADLVVWVGPMLEGALADYLAARAPQALITFADVVAVDAAAPASQHDHGHGSDHHGHNTDPHLWLQPAYAERLAAQLRRHFALPAMPLLSREELGDWHRQLGRLQNRGWLMSHRSLDYFSDFFSLAKASALDSVAGAEGGLRHQLSLLQQGNYRCLLAEQSEPDRRLARFAAQLQRPLLSADTLGAAQSLQGRPYSEFIAALVAVLQHCLSAP